MVLTRQTIIRNYGKSLAPDAPCEMWLRSQKFQLGLKAGGAAELGVMTAPSLHGSLGGME